MYEGKRRWKEVAGQHGTVLTFDIFSCFSQGEQQVISTTQAVNRSVPQRNEAGSIPVERSKRGKSKLK